jgi:predicted Ser/Thr protein kinase
MIGSTLAHYRLEAVLGRGGMGIVYRAHDDRLNRSVAIKVLSGPSGDTLQQLLREARAASGLSHAGVVTIHSVEQDGDVHFIVMEFLDGRSLADAIPPSGVSIATALDYATQIAGALAAAHQAGIVHRDVKPANAIVTPSGQVKLLDFGIARRLAIDPQAATRAMTFGGTIAPEGTLTGTIAYLAPEQIAGEPAQPRTDVFALGVVLYEMLSGRRPFRGDTIWAVMDATLHLPPEPLRSIRPDVSASLERVVDRCLEKAPEKRFQSATEVLAALKPLQESATPPRPRRRALTAVEIAVAVVLAAVIGAFGWSRIRDRRQAAVRTTIGEIARLAAAGDFVGSYRLALAARTKYPDNPQIVQAWQSTIALRRVSSQPEGADVAIRTYDGSDEGWIPIGRTPFPNGIGIPLAQMRWRVTKEGYEPLEVSPNESPYVFHLAPIGTTPKAMVRVPAGPLFLESAGDSVNLPDFFIDTYEVTNRQFKEFVHGGGYTKREFWTEPIEKDGRPLSWEEAMAKFRDTTGRPGPSTWELGTYPDGQDDYPVSGVSWYEAAAYAKFTGRSLPTVYHWYRASGAFGIFSEILRFSNFGGKGTVQVGSLKGLGPYGTYDMAGNVKEWCSNEAEHGKRFVLGGAFNEANYQFRDQDARAPTERSAGFGLRLILQRTPVVPALLQPIVSLERDPGTLKPVDDAVYAVYRHLYDYDPTPLEARVEEEDAGNSSWTRQRVTFRAAYPHERVPADIYLPKTGRPPFHAVIYFPGSDSQVLQSSRNMWTQWIEFIVRSGRAVVYPIYQHTYERQQPRPLRRNAMREIGIQRALDLRRAVDYLETRSDIDHTRIAGYGLSLGAQLMPTFLAVEPRLKVGVLLSGGFETWDVPAEWDPVNFAPRVTQPVLMVNGREDFDLPYQSAQVPLFQMLGTPPADKQHVLLEGGHIPPHPALVFKEILDWLDKYLGPVTN